ncbi:uncharacterized protein TNCV_2342031 [Trichonephila clavipes]|nr:uncharacterized protein TNCV_2342031 [Trichonephila clavipes]
MGVEKQLLWSETWSTGGGRLTYLQSLETLAGQSGVAFTPWVAVPGEYPLDLLRPLATVRQSVVLEERKSALGPVESCSSLPRDAGVYFTPLKSRHFKTLCSFLINSPDRAHSIIAFSQRSSSPRLIEDETFNDSDIINNLID